MIGPKDLSELAEQLRSGVISKPIDQQKLATILDGVATFLQWRETEHERLRKSHEKLWARHYKLLDQKERHHEILRPADLPEEIQTRTPGIDPERRERT